MVAPRCEQWISRKEKGVFNFIRQICLEEEEMSPAEPTKTVSCPFSVTASNSSLVTWRRMQHLFETTVFFVSTRLSALRSVRGRRCLARDKSLHKTGVQFKRGCPRLSKAGRRGPANASLHMLSRLETSAWRAILGETFRIASVQHYQASSYP